MKIAVIGAGAAGRQFAVACAVAGFAVVLEDVMPARLRSAAAVFASLGAEVELVSTVEDAVADADWVIDFVPDELESKLEIFSLLDRMAPPRTVLCTPSESLSITDIASCTYRPGQCVMLRGLAGDPVRVLTAPATLAEASRITVGVMTALGRRSVVEADPDLPMLMKNMGYGSSDAPSWKHPKS